MIVELVDNAMARASWGLLGALGMSSSLQLSIQRAVEPESALLLAALAASGDPRLADEARDWLVRYQDLVARPVLKRRLANLDDIARDRWRVFASPATPFLVRALPGADGATAGWSPSGKTVRRSLASEPATGYLRYRAAFGVQARSGILQLLAGREGGRGWMADALARSTGYSKAAVREALDRMVEAGLLRVTRVGNADWFAAVDPEGLQHVAGPPGTGVVDFDVAVTGFWALHNAAVALDEGSPKAGPVRARDLLDKGEAARALIDLKVQVPSPVLDLDELRVQLVQSVSDAATRLGHVEHPLWPW